MADIQDRALDWDEVTEVDCEDRGFRVLEDGYYPFTVAGFERERFAGSAKMPSCSMAKLTLAVQDGPVTVNVFQRLYLTSRQLWKIGQFFRCIGAPRGENGKTVINWAMVEGAQGWAKVKKRTYDVQQGEHKGESRETNDIEFFCAPEETEKAWRAYCAQNGEDPDAIMGRPAQQPQAQQQPAYGQPQPQAQQQVWQGQPDPQAQPQQQAWQQPQAQQAAAPWSMS